MVKFKARPWKTGGSYVIVIPCDFITHGIISLDHDTEFEVKEE